MQIKSKARLILAAALTVLGAPGSAVSQAYPSKPIKFILPFPPAGPTDNYARIIAQRLGDALGQPVVVENRPGGTGVIAARAVRGAAADGHILLFTSNSAHVVAPLTKTPSPFDPVSDFTPVTMLIRYPMYFMANAGLDAKNLGEFVALAKSSGRFGYASAGVGTGTHLACELINMVTNSKMEHIPYQGAALAQAAVVSGEVQGLCDSVAFSQPLVNAGKLRGLVVTGEKRSVAAPDVPTLAEVGIPGVATYTWLGILGPAGMPREVVQKLNSELTQIMNSPELRDRVTREGSEVVAEGAEAFTRKIREESVVWLRVIRDKAIKTD